MYVIFHATAFAVK